MALAYGGANSHRTDCGTAAAANLSAGSFLVCFLPNPLTGGKSWIGKGTGAIGSGWNCFTRAGGSLQIARFQLQRATTDMQVDSAAGTIQTTGLQWLGVAWDVGAGSALMVHGTIAALMSDVSSGLIAGSGAQNDDSGNQFVVGNDPANGSSWVGSIAYSIVWNRALSLADFRSQQFRPRVDSGCVHFMAHGYNGTSTQPDWSGSGNAGTVTGATVADHAPIPFRRSGAIYAPRTSGQTYTISPAGVLVPVSVLAKSALKVYVGTAAPSGATTRETWKTAAGAIVPSGSNAQLADKGLFGSIVPTGLITNAASAVYVGALLPAGALLKSIALTLAGGLAPSGTIATIRAVLRTFTGDLLPTGAIVRDISKSTSGAVAPLGAIAQAVSATLRGTLSPAGGLNKFIQTFWSGVLGWLGQLTTSTGAAPVPSRLEVIGSYVPVLAVTAAYQNQLAVTGAYAPAIAVTGEFDA